MDLPDDAGAYPVYGWEIAGWICRMTLMLIRPTVVSRRVDKRSVIHRRF
ncbi:hypothetical protein [Dryocola sp. LX212]